MKIKPYSVKRYLHEAIQAIVPPERLLVSEWAEKYRMLDGKSSRAPGPWSNEMTPYLVGVMDEFNNPDTRTIVFCKPTQIGGTEALQNMVGYVVMQDPSPTMIVYPTKELAKSVSENRLKPMLMATPEIAERFDENSEMMELQFDGMYLSLAGSNSPAGLASKPIRYLFLDEVDKYPEASRKEADPIKLATERTKTFSNAKIYITSTPTIKEGHIWRAKESADVEKHYFVPCPHCGAQIEFRWGQVSFPKEDGMSQTDRADLAVYICQECGGAITDNDKHNILPYGEWVEVRRSKRYASTVAFWLNTLYSPFVRWSDIAKEFLVSKEDPSTLQNFVNSWLAEPWEDARFASDPSIVMERQTELPEFIVPKWAKLLTAGVDVQQNSLYWTIRAWGDHLTSQNVCHGQVISFDDIDEIMNREYLSESGERFMVDLCLVDSGYNSDVVYDFCLTHSDYAAAAKGANHEQMSHYKISSVNKEGSSANGLPLVMVDGGKYKDMIASRLRKDNGVGSWMVHGGCDEAYAKQITSEHKVNVTKGGVTKAMWKLKSVHGDNHWLDCEVYAMAAADIKGVRSLHLGGEQEAVSKAKEDDGQWLSDRSDWMQGVRL